MASVSDIAIPPDDDIATAVLVEDVGLSADLPLFPPAATRDTARWLWCLIAAALLHAAVLTILNWPDADNALGGGGTDLDAISVDVIQASALQTIVDGATTGSAMSTAALAEHRGSDREQQAAAEAPDRKQQQKPAAAANAEIADLVMPDAVKMEPPAPDLPSIMIAATKAEHKVDESNSPIEVKAPPDSTVAVMASTPSAAAVAESLGGATARGVAVVEMAAQSAAIAITGELGAYARRVQQAVARNPPRMPRGENGRGDVVITFALGLDGSLLRAQVLSSSGNAALDEAALATVRSARFPPPPAGSQPAQLVYRFPVKFR